MEFRSNGDIMDNSWNIYTIKELTEKVGMGPFGSSIKVETFVNSGIPVISGAHLKGIKLEDNNYNFITIDHADRLANANVYRGDVIFTHAGNIGAVAYIPSNSKYERYVLSQRQFYLRCNREKLLPEFITYYFKSPFGQKKLLANTSSSGVPSISQPVTYLRSIEVEVPSIGEQEKIVTILSSLDDKIELNNKMNRTLESIAEAIFKHWFIGFQFPDSNHQDKNILPEGWNELPLVEQFNITMGQSPPGESYNEDEEGVLFFQGRSDFGFRFPSPRLYTKDPRRLANKFDTLVSVRAPVGDINMALDNCCVGRGLSSVIHKSGYSSYTYYFMRAVQSKLKQYDLDGTVFGSITKKNFQNILGINPPDNLARQFNDLVKPIDEKIYNNTLENNRLITIRDMLLPKLITGQIQVNL